jgi:hypothetical protein
MSIAGPKNEIAEINNQVINVGFCCYIIMCLTLNRTMGCNNIHIMELETVLVCVPCCVVSL